MIAAVFRLAPLRVRTFLVSPSASQHDQRSVAQWVHVPRVNRTKRCEFFQFEGVGRRGLVLPAAKGPGPHLLRRDRQLLSLVRIRVAARFDSRRFHLPQCDRGDIILTQRRVFPYRRNRPRCR